jgi:hypothetical protein
MVAFWRFEQTKIILELHYILDQLRVLLHKTKPELRYPGDRNMTVMLETRNSPGENSFITLDEDLWSERNQAIMSKATSNQNKLLELRRSIERLESKLDEVLQGIQRT